MTFAYTLLGAFCVFLYWNTIKIGKEENEELKRLIDINRISFPSANEGGEIESKNKDFDNKNKKYSLR